MLYSWDWVLDFVKACKMAVIWVISPYWPLCWTAADRRRTCFSISAGVLISILATSSLAWARARPTSYLYVQLSLYGAKAYLHMDDVNYVVSSIVFVAAASIVATLVVKLQKQMQIANKKRDYGQDE